MVHYGAMHRGWNLALGVTCVAEMLASCSTAKHAAPTTTTSTATSPSITTMLSATTTVATLPGDVSLTVNQRLTDLIQANGPTVETATELFSIEVANLPGVTIPAGKVEHPMSGGWAALQLQLLWDKLTPEQQNVAAPYLGGTANPTTPETFDGFTALTQTFPTTTTPAGVVNAAYRPGVKLPGSHMALPASAVEDKARAYFKPMFEWANKSIAALIGRSNPLPEPFDIRFDSALEAWAESGYFDDHLIGGSSRRATCKSTINLAYFANQDFATQLSVVTHETFHCYQQAGIATGAQVSSIAKWLHEGEATWVQTVLVPTAAFPSMQDKWSVYFTQPAKSLVTRDYDAVGFFAHLSDVAGVDAVAHRLIDGYTRGVGGANEDAFSALAAQDEDRLVDTWSSSSFLKHHNSDLWDIRLPGAQGNLPSDGSTPRDVSINDKQSGPIGSAEPWQLELVKLTSNADILEVTLQAGHLAIIDAAEKMNQKISFGDPIDYCLIDSCKCPTGTTSEPPSAIPAKAPFDVGITGGRHKASASARGMSLDEFCKRIKDPNPPGGGAGGGGNTSVDPPPSNGSPHDGFEPPNGKATSDPHLSTIDGRWYDLHAVGEFVLSRSTIDDFAVDVRFGGSSGNRTWSTATQMATHDGTDRITVTMNLAATQPEPVLRINGVESTNGSVHLTSSVVRRVQTPYGPGYIVSFADGTRVGASSTARAGLSVWVDPAAPRKGKLTGLLGDGDGNKTNDPVGQNSGTILPAEPAYAQLYTDFANTWRLTQAESLLDYKATETTATFTDVSFPDQSAPPLPVAAVEAATKRCQASGLTDRDLIRNCSFDLAATNNSGFLITYRTQQVRADYVHQLFGNGNVTNPAADAGTIKSFVLEGTLKTSEEQPTKSFTARKGQIVYFDKVNCVDRSFSTLTDSSGNNLGGSFVTCGTRVEIPHDGTYTITLNPTKSYTGEYHIAIIGVRADRVTKVTPGQTMSGTITNAAEHDVFQLTIASPTSITVGGAACQANFDVSILFGDNETFGAGPACRLGTLTLPKAGTYQFIFNPFDSATGSYSVAIIQP